MTETNVVPSQLKTSHRGQINFASTMYTSNKGEDDGKELSGKKKKKEKKKVAVGVSEELPKGRSIGCLYCCCVVLFVCFLLRTTHVHNIVCC